MKYDIAKNEDGPLRRTLKNGVLANATSTSSTSKVGANGAPDEVPSASRYPALDERLQNVEKHLAIRYGGSRLYLPPYVNSTVLLVPLPPRSLLDRLKYLEDHVIHLEKEYPPWAALHFNQPNRGVSTGQMPLCSNIIQCVVPVAATTPADADHCAVSSDIHCRSRARRVSDVKYCFRIGIDAWWSFHACHGDDGSEGKGKARATHKVEPAQGRHGEVGSAEGDQRSYRGRGLAYHRGQQERGR